MTCNGCHQARAIEGFHLLGEERDNKARLNALAVGSSPHFNDELPWRERFLDAVADRKAISEPRPFAERGTSTGQFGAHCGLGNAGFRSWTCAQGLTCMNINGDLVGICSPARNPAGDACETARVTENADEHADRVVDLKTLSCDLEGKGVKCAGSSDGFPNGMCLEQCSELGAMQGNTICGGVPFGTGKLGGINHCLFELGRPFKQCLADDYKPTQLRACDAKRPCRDDYACTRVKGAPPGIGSCMPPYFVFQGRVDGHVLDR
jgi:hypothetical protein